MISFQCSPHATSAQVEQIFKKCAILQGAIQTEEENSDRVRPIAVAVFDEIGLAETSRRLPLKALHPLLEEGISVNGEPLTSKHKCSFIGISNWALDPSKMNRGIFVTRTIPDRHELFETAKFANRCTVSIY